MPTQITTNAFSAADKQFMALPAPDILFAAAAADSTFFLASNNNRGPQRPPPLLYSSKDAALNRVPLLPPKSMSLMQKDGDVPLETEAQMKEAARKIKEADTEIPKAAKKLKGVEPKEDPADKAGPSGGTEEEQKMVTPFPH